MYLYLAAIFGFGIGTIFLVLFFHEYINTLRLNHAGVEREGWITQKYVRSAKGYDRAYYITFEFRLVEHGDRSSKTQFVNYSTYESVEIGDTVPIRVLPTLSASARIWGSYKDNSREISFLGTAIIVVIISIFVGLFMPYNP